MSLNPEGEHTSIDIEIIWKKIYNQLDEQETMEFDRWIAKSDDNKRFFQQVLSHHAEGDSYQRYHRKEAAWNTIIGESTGSEPSPNGSTSWKLWGSVAASLTLLLCLTLYYFLSGPVEKEMPLAASAPISPGSDKAILVTSSGHSIELAQQNDTLNTEDNDVSIVLHEDNLTYAGATEDLTMNKLIVPRGGKFQLTLTDGTRVWLNSETTLEYPISFSETVRSVSLIGEAYFEVIPDDKPFVVNTRTQKIQVLGTSFNVSDFEDLRESSTTLVEGKVEVLHKQSAYQTLLSPDQHLVLNKQSGESTLIQEDIRRYVAWKDDLFVFEEASLEWIMGKLSRWYDIDVFFQNTKRKQVIFSGEIDRYEEFEKVLDLLEMTDEAQFEIKDRTVIVK